MTDQHPAESDLVDSMRPTAEGFYWFLPKGSDCWEPVDIMINAGAWRMYRLHHDGKDLSSSRVSMKPVGKRLKTRHFDHMGPPEQRGANMKPQPTSPIAVELAVLALSVFYGATTAEWVSVEQPGWRGRCRFCLGTSEQAVQDPEEARKLPIVHRQMACAAVLAERLAARRSTDPELARIFKVAGEEWLYPSTQTGAAVHQALAKLMAGVRPDHAAQTDQAGTAVDACPELAAQTDQTGATVPAELGQAGVAVPAQPDLAAVAVPAQPDQAGAAPGVKRAFLGLNWEVVPWNRAGAELPLGVIELLEKCGRTLFRMRELPQAYLVADYDPDVARLLAQGSPDAKRAALRGILNLIDEAGHAEWEIEDELRKLDAASGGGRHVD